MSLLKAENLKPVSGFCFVNLGKQTNDRKSLGRRIFSSSSHAHLAERQTPKTKQKPKKEEKQKYSKNIWREKQILQDDPQEKHRDLGVLMFSNKGSFFSRDELIGLFLLLEYTERYDRAVLQHGRREDDPNFAGILSILYVAENNGEKNTTMIPDTFKTLFFFFLFFYRPGPIRWKL